MRLTSCVQQRLMKDDRSSFIVHRSSFRPGFTLVELLVVIAIIAILFSLTSAAVIKVMAVGDETTNRTDIAKLEVAVQDFMRAHGVDYVPSRILLKEGGYSATATGLERDSLTYLKRVWPNLQAQVDWDGDGSAAGTWTLEGDQCLVFFVGGIPALSGIGTTGFSTNTRDPAWHIRNGGETKGPYYEFKSNRLVKNLPGRSPSRFFSYLDAYGRGDGNGGIMQGAPFAYFSCYKAGNDYGRYGTSDCQTLGVMPYRDPSSTPVQYHNRNGFQIISAGADRMFGPGGPWSPSTAAGTPAAGRDDHANFYDRKLGTAQ